MEYLDFELEIDAGSGLDYPVRVDSPAGQARATMHFPYDSLALENHLLTLQNALLRHAGPDNPCRREPLGPVFNEPL